MDILQNCKIDALVPLKEAPIVVHSEQTINEVLNELAKNRVTSAPVLELSTNKPLGFVDMLDLTWFALNVSKGLPGKHDVVGRTELFGNEKVKRVMGDSMRNPFLPLRLGSTLLDAAKICKQGVHRIPVLNEKDEIVSIISQSDIVTFLYENRAKLRAVLDLKLKEFGTNLIHHKVISTSSDAITLDALGLLFSKGVNAIAVVDKDGKIVETLSPSDLKGLYGRSFENLVDPVWEYLRNVKTLKQGNTFTASVPDTATLGECLEKLVNLSVHRVWVVDAEHKPVGVVSLTDILYELLGEERS